MHASTAPDDGRGVDLKEALAHLEQALEIIDSNKVSLAVGARLQEVVDLLKTPDGVWSSGQLLSADKVAYPFRIAGT